MASIFSLQQSAAIRAAVRINGGNIIVAAKAGAGKTYTMVNGVCVELSKLSDNIAFLAYGARIAAEAKLKVERLGLQRSVRVSTCHSAGFGAYRRAYNCRLNGNGKLRDLAREEFNGQYETWRPFVTSTVEKAKDIGIGVVCPDDDISAWIALVEKFNLADSLPENVTIDQGINGSIHLLRASVRQTSIIDYSDMIYMPLVKGVRIWQYDYVIVDECQDINPTRRELVSRMMRPGGKLIAVGDPNQAIFGFTGADYDAIDRLVEQFNAKILPLSVSFRCPKSVVKVAQQWVPDIEAAEDAPEGIVDSCELQDIAKLAGPQDVILCRNTKPLVSLAYSLLRQRIACKVEGRDIGTGLIKLATRWKTVKTVGQLEAKVEQWAATEMAKAKAKGQDSRCQAVEDQSETLRVFIEQCDDSDPIATLTGLIESLFVRTEDGEDQECLMLSTVHKTKGREWRRVFALGMDRYSPSPWAKQSWELTQEDNLQYVQVTRAKEHLTLVNVPAKDI